MSSPESDFDPYSRSELYSLISEKCGGCNYAKLVIAMACFEVFSQNPLAKIHEIDQRCTGYEGPDETSEYYFEGGDRSGCPYLLIKNEEKD